MPRISRVRFINYAWRDRRIDDLILNFRFGMNTEVRLVNGGGKSVLQRLMYQAIHPNTTISGNRVEDYLKNTPAMTVIEWILDQPDSSSKPEVITTGVLLSKSETKEDSNSIVHYFTFISNNQEYLSLDKIPNVVHEAGVIRIEPYISSQNKYRNLANNHSEIFYYQSADRRRYQERLEDFGISARNWKEIIFPMISSEDPFKVFLNNSKTEDKLINEYLLPNIEEHISRNGNSKSNIKKILLENVEHLAKEKETIAVRDALQSYLEDVKEQDAVLNGVIDAKAHEEEAKRGLAGFYHALRIRQDSLEEEQTSIEGRLNGAEKDLQTIDKEERSYKWYLAKDVVEKETAKYLRSELEEKESFEAEKNLRHHKEVLTARNIYDEVLSLTGSLNGYKETLQNLEQSEESERRLNLSSTLHHLIKNELNRLGKEKEELADAEDTLESKLKSDEHRAEADSHKRDELIQELGQLGERIQGIEKKEAALVQNLGTTHTLRRNFLNQLIPEDVKAVRRELNSQSEQAQRKLEEIQKERDHSAEIIKEIYSVQNKLELEKAGHTAARKQKEDLLREYQTKKESLKKYLERYGLSKELLFHRDRLNEECETRRQINGKETDDIKYQLALQKELRNSADTGSIYIPDSIRRLLEANRIEYQTGEGYISSIKKSEQNKRLRQVPLLPFSILMTQEQYKKLEIFDFQGQLIRQIIPVYTYQELEDPEISSAHGRFLYNTNASLFDNEERARYLETLQRKIGENEKKIASLSDELIRLNEFTAEITRFDYEESFEKRMNAELMDHRHHITRIESELLSGQEKIRAVSSRMNELNTRIPLVLTEIDTWSNRTKQFEQFLNTEEPEYIRALNQKSEREAERKKLESALQQLRNNIFAQRKERDYIKKRIAELEWNISDEQNNLSRYLASESYTKIEGERTALEKEYETLSESASEQESSLQKKIEETEQLLLTRNKQFKLTRISTEEVIQVRWTSGEVQRTDRELEDAVKKAGECRRNKEAAITEKSRAEADFDNAAERLKETGLEEPLPEEKIRMHFDERRKETKEEIVSLTGAVSGVREKIRISSAILEQLGSYSFTEASDSSVIATLIREDTKTQFRELKDAYEQSISQTKERRNDYLQIYRRLKDSYISRNVLFQKLYAAENSVENHESLSLVQLQSFKESEDVRRRSLEKTLNMYNTDLNSLEQDLNEMVHSVISYTKRLAEALGKISRQSKMKISGRATPVQLLRIGVNEESRESAERLEHYLRSEIARLAEKSKDNDSAVNRDADRILNSRTLIGRFLNQERIPVRVYRFDQNSAQSGLVEWETATRSNSTGEHSTSCFVIIATMMAYARGSDKELEDGRHERYETIICDNPFASVSSEYLVKPLINIVNNLHLQLIAFTHLTQQSIANSFDVVIQLRNASRRSGTSGLIVGEESVSEEVMEQASLFSSTQQIGLF